VSTRDDRAPVALPLALIAAAAIVTAALVGYVRLKSAQVDAGYRVHDLRARLVVLEQQRAALEVARAALARPQRLAHIARTALALVPPEVQTTAAEPGEAR
jgi:cell division protein FtsL